MVASKTNPYDIFSSQAQRNHVLYEQMRNEDPVHAAIHPQTGQTYWFLTRYADCLRFLKDKRFGREYRRRLPPHLTEKWAVNDAVDIVNQHMLNRDDPDHARLKSLVHLAFTPIRISLLYSKLQAIADSLLDTIDIETDYGSEFDLTTHYIDKLPLLAISEMLGFPIEDFQTLYSWTHYMLLTDEHVVHQAIAEFSEYVNDQIDRRHIQPTDDLLSGLMFAEEDGDRLRRPELLAMIYLLITAGYETMVSFVSNSILTLFENPDQMRLLQQNLDNPTVLRSAIEEMLRYNGPSHLTLECWAYEDVELGGKVIRQGDIVHAVLHAANRDPAIFANPDEFNILRHPNKHIAFSYGIHHCLGAALARLEGEIAIATLLRRFPNL